MYRGTSVFEIGKNGKVYYGYVSLRAQEMMASIEIPTVKQYQYHTVRKFRYLLSCGLYTLLVVMVLSRNILTPRCSAHVMFVIDHFLVE